VTECSISFRARNRVILVLDGWLAITYIYIIFLISLHHFSSHSPPLHPIFQREVLSRGLGVRWGTTRRRLGSSGEDILLSGATALCGTMPCPGSGFAYCVGNAKLENDRVDDVSKPVSGKAMCRALRYVSAFLKLDRCVVVSGLGGPPNLPSAMSSRSHSASQTSLSILQRAHVRHRGMCTPHLYVCSINAY
jgi:hypothetical protein